MCYCTPSIRTPYCHNCNQYMRTEIEQLRLEVDALNEESERIAHHAAAVKKENESLRMMGSPVVEATIQHQAMEIMKLKQQVAELRDALSGCLYPQAKQLEALARTAKEE